MPRQEYVGRFLLELRAFDVDAARKALECLTGAQIRLLKAHGDLARALSENDVRAGVEATETEMIVHSSQEPDAQVKAFYPFFGARRGRSCGARGRRFLDEMKRNGLFVLNRLPQLTPSPSWCHSHGQRSGRLTMAVRWFHVGISCLAFSCAPPQEVGPVTPWPTSGWSVASSADEGMDASRLDALDDALETRHGNIDGMLVIRHGHIVYESQYERDYDAFFDAGAGAQAPGMYNYYDPDWHPYYQRGDLHTMQSVTKSVTSALIGIAIGRGEIPGVDVEVLDYLEGYDVPHAEDWSAMTLEDLLTMRAGIAWDENTVPYTDPANSCAGMEGSDDWVQFVAEQPISETPGTVFNYNSGASQLLSLILKKSTGEFADIYAEEHLFGPLGIARYFWKKTPKGFPDTEGGLYLTPRDLAKFGYLYLNDGMWDGVRLLPDGWVQASMERSVTNAGSGGIGYGYQWWLVPWGTDSDTRYAYTCLGYGGQRLLVVPERDLIAVFTGWNVYDMPALDPSFALRSVLEAIEGP